MGPSFSRLPDLSVLFDIKVPGVIHDSSERYLPPPFCHPGTRRDYIEQLVQWGVNTNHHADHIMLVRGPAGVGKSAIAQSCAEALEMRKNLGASFFFSALNHRNNPSRLFTSIAQQLTSRFRSYNAILIGDSPRPFAYSLRHQFRDLLVAPFARPSVKEEVGNRVIIVDGLDECDGIEAQVDIIKIIAESVRAGTTPLLWIFFSRFEPAIVAAFELPEIKSVSQQIDLPVSREIDGEIQLYLADTLRGIGRSHHFDLPWPSEGDIWALVDFSAGWFACANAIISFIRAGSRADPQVNLNKLLRLTERSAAGHHNPHLTALDECYTHIMERLPAGELEMMQWILLTMRLLETNNGYKPANLLKLGEIQFRGVCQYLHPTMKVETGDNASIIFYDVSFMDFLEDPVRSGKFCIWEGYPVTLLEEILRHLDQVQVDIDTNGRYIPCLPVTWPGNQYQIQHRCYADHILVILKLLSSFRLEHGTQILRTLINFDFRKMCFEWQWRARSLTDTEVAPLMQNLDLISNPRRPRIFWRLWASLHTKSTSRYYTIGEGEKRAQVVIDDVEGVWFEPYSPQLFEIYAKNLYESKSAA